MKKDVLTYIAHPGQIDLGDLTNTDPCHIRIEGYAIPGHFDPRDGHPVGAGFDIVSMSLAQPSEFCSAQAVVIADVGHQFHWRQVPQAVQWADEQVGGHRG